MANPISPDPQQRASIRELYGERYAKAYEELWEDNELWKPETAHHIRTIGELIDRLGDDIRWLDAGCGTGYFLSQFSHVTRAGFDLSPRMLEQARRRNPDALFLREQDLCRDVAEWHGAWDLVTCTGQPWSYLSSMDEIETALDNLARYTAPGGLCMLQPGDLADLNGCRLPYDFSDERPLPGTTVITGVIWSHYEEEATHINMIWPSLDVWVKWFAKHFKRIEIVHWPHDPPHPILHIPRRVIIGSDKRSAGDDEPALVMYAPPASITAPPHSAPESAGSPDPAIARESEHQVDAPLAVETDDVAPTTASVDIRDNGGAAASPTRLYDQPISYVVRRLNPLEPRFWRSVARRTRAARRRRHRSG